LSNESPSTRPQRSAVLTSEDVRANAAISESEGCASCGPVEERAGVARPVSAKPRHFQRIAIVSHARHRAAYNHHAHQGVAQCRAQAELVANDRLVMPM